MDGPLAVIGLGSIGSVASWQVSRLSDSIVGFEAHAAIPAFDGLEFLSPKRFRS